MNKFISPTYLQPLAHMPREGYGCGLGAPAREHSRAMSSEPAEKRIKMSLKLGYWKLRGLAQPIRLLLKYTETEFEDIRYEQGDAPDYSRDSWLSVKYTLGLDFPNLPYLIDDDVRITQSMAIMRYISRKHDLCGKTEAQKIEVDMMAQEIADFRTGFVRLCYDPNMASKRDDYIKAAKQRIKNISNYLGKRPWITGDSITFVDFILYEMLDQHRLFEPGLLDDFANLKASVDRLEALPAIKEYMKSDEFIQRPVNNKIAQWK